ncbi:hypothetical protein NDI85_10100 [Halomicroarcula sp. S1AR25-4]|uniref:hypothetical protein n=1 Tax=Haloarcula sp. S1AR25-4 TaxID=2950538 RepID=UPI0028761E8D|nr:hypothetical protein [Halomicroarcula sp. S1AR25-4]MDS0278146.1 hypothetical protein [Halomicroarcula sp. S1AR25-4]
MVTLLPFVVGVGFVVAAVGGLYEVTNYTETQRRRERRLVQAFTYGCLLVLALGLATTWVGFQNADLPFWLFASLSVAVVGVVFLQRRLRQRLDAD